MEGTYDHTSLYTCMKFTRISKSFKSEKKYLRRMDGR